jgi:hypothetical protein
MKRRCAAATFFGAILMTSTLALAELKGDIIGNSVSNLFHLPFKWRGCPDMSFNDIKLKECETEFDHNTQFLRDNGVVILQSSRCKRIHGPNSELSYGYSITFR